MAEARQPAKRLPSCHAATDEESSEDTKDKKWCGEENVGITKQVLEVLEVDILWPRWVALPNRTLGSVGVRRVVLA